LFGIPPLKAQNDYILYKFWIGHGPLGPPGYAYVLRPKYYFQPPGPYHKGNHITQDKNG